MVGQNQKTGLGTMAESWRKQEVQCESVSILCRLKNLRTGTGAVT